MTAKRYLIIISLLLPLSLGCAHSQTGRFGQEADNESTNIFIFLYRGPLNRLSAVRQGACPMHPSCSEYASEVLHKFGFPQGVIMVFDRLIRCGGDELRLSPAVSVDGALKCYDPAAF